MSASTPPTPSLTLLSLREFFRQTLEAVLREQGLETSEDTAFYIVNLLASFANPSHLHPSPSLSDPERPLALLLRDALEASQQAAAIRLYRQIGDQALYIAGFFSKRFDRERRVVSRGYYYDMGRRAYDTLSALHERRNDTICLLYAELADKFSSLAEALNALSERHSFDPASSPSDLIERWSRSQSASASARLIQHGYLPLLRFDPASDQPPPEPSIIEVTNTRRRPKNEPLD